MPALEPAVISELSPRFVGLLGPDRLQALRPTVPKTPERKKGERGHP